MRSTKPATSKRAILPREARYTKRFHGEWTTLSRSGRYDMVRAKEVMITLIANDAPLSAEWLDHPLKGEWVGHRECHIGGDFLLVYRVDPRGSDEVITFVAIGTHSQLFK